jgi:choline dehydrogenase
MRDYDYIIIGGGSAGCLLARRLVQTNRGAVALIEAGGASINAKADVRTVVPAYYPKTFGSRLDWAYASEPQTGLNGRRISWPRGKTLGGSGAINALIYMQAAAGDFERWASSGCPGWEWPSLSNSLIKLGSPLSQCPVSDLELREIAEPHPWSQAFLEACTAYGLQPRQSWMQAESNTCGFFSLTQTDGRRHHTGLQLSDVSPHANLDLFLGSNVRSLKIIRDRVVKVGIVDRSNQLVELRANGEVILCAGTIGSPTILLRSGIGPAAALRRLGIDVQHDLPGVGENLQDHLVYPLVYRTQARDGMQTRFNLAERQRYRQLESGTKHGPLASNIAEAGAMFTQMAPTFHRENREGPRRIEGNENSAENQPADKYAAASQFTHSTADFQIHFTPTHYLKYPSRGAPRDCLTLAVTDLHPRSRGRLQLGNANPKVPPRIDPGYLEHHEDAPRLLGAIERCRQIANQTSLNILIADELLPSRKRAEPASILRSVQSFAQSIYHPVGTCRMGLDAQAVVSPELRVHGFCNLHVADASVLPDLPSGNTNAVTLLVAARKYDFLTRRLDD